VLESVPMQGFAGSIVARLRSQRMRESLPYTLGRFNVVRKLYGGFLGTLQSVGAVPGVREKTSNAVSSPPPEVLTAALRSDSAYIGLRIEAARVAEANRTGTTRTDEGAGE